MENQTLGIEQVIVAFVAFGLDAFPRVNTWWEQFNEKQKQILIMFFVFIVTLSAAGYNCYQGGFCPADWVDFIVTTAVTFIVNLVISQGTHFGSRYLVGDQPTTYRPQ